MSSVNMQSVRIADSARIAADKYTMVSHVKVGGTC